MAFDAKPAAQPERFYLTAWDVPESQAAAMRDALACVVFAQPEGLCETDGEGRCRLTVRVDASDERAFEQRLRIVKHELRYAGIDYALIDAHEAR